MAFETHTIVDTSVLANPSDWVVGPELSPESDIAGTLDWGATSSTASFVVEGNRSITPGVNWYESNDTVEAQQILHAEQKIAIGTEVQLIPIPRQRILEEYELSPGLSSEPMTEIELQMVRNMLAILPEDSQTELRRDIAQLKVNKNGTVTGGHIPIYGYRLKNLATEIVHTELMRNDIKLPWGTVARARLIRIIGMETSKAMMIYYDIENNPQYDWYAAGVDPVCVVISPGSQDILNHAASVTYAISAAIHSIGARSEGWQDLRNAALKWMQVIKSETNSKLLKLVESMFGRQYGTILEELQNAPVNP